MSTPNDREQLLLELINRARLDPLGEAARYGIDLNQGLLPGTISAEVKAPLAMNPYLVDAARNHSLWMLNADTFSHEGIQGSSPGDRMETAGYGFNGSWTWGENISWTGTGWGSLDATAAIYDQHRNLFLSAGHRTNILSSDFVEIGTGQALGGFTDDGYTWNASMVTEAFARTGSTSNTLTGVVYSDTDHNSFYSAGEGRGGVNVAIFGQPRATTYSAGGYSIGNLTGSKTVTFSGGGLVASVSATVLFGSESVKLDLVNGTTLRSSADTVIGNGATSLTLLGDAKNGTGNALANTLTGNRFTNTLHGMAGNDILSGKSGTDILVGEAGSDTILGGNGRDYLFGRDGNDRLSGGSGRDFFVFDCAVNRTTNKDTITDFSHADDTIRLDRTIFTRFATGPLLSSQFRASSAGTAVDRNDFFLYNTSTGALLYDQDGSGAGTAIPLATLTNRPQNVAYNDFVVVA